MTSTTTSTPATTSNPPSASPSVSQEAAQITLDELTQLENTVQPSLNALATGDGSTPALLGALMSLQGALTSNVSTFQKIGVNDTANLVSTAFAAWIASLKAKVSKSNA